MRSATTSVYARVWRVLVPLWVCVLGLLGCDDADSATDGDETQGDVTAVSSVIVNPGGIVLPPEATPITNPLELAAPAGQPDPENGQRIFAVPDKMLKNARVGTTMKLASATFLSREGENFLIRVGFGAPYEIHPAYVVVPKPDRFRRSTYVIASYNGELRHGVVKSLIRDRINVRFTDLGVKRGDQRLDPKRVGILSSGLAPGAYAAHLAEHEYRHVLLVSSSVVAGKVRWLVIRYTGETELVSEDRLEPLPVSRFKPRVGMTVLAAWRGTLVRTQVKAIDRPSLLTVTRPRAGRALIVGPGMVMPTD